MVCTTLTVIEPRPLVDVVSDTTGFSGTGVYLNGDCSVLVTDITGNIGAGVTIRVSTAKAKYDLEFNYTLDGVPQSFRANGITQDIGDMTQFVATSTPYLVGTYAGLTATVINVTAA